MTAINKIKGLQAKLDRAFELTLIEFGAELTKQISDPKWRWRDGQLRDIVDSGRLRNSQQIIYLGELEGTIRYPVDYAAKVRFGYTFVAPSGARIVFPGRDWVLAALINFDFAARFKANLR